MPVRSSYKNDAEGIHVGCGAERLAGDLLGRGIVRGLRAAGELGEAVLHGCPFVDQLGNAEVEQPDLAVGGDEDVRRLEVTVHDELAVRVGNGVDAPAGTRCRIRTDVEAALSAVLINRTAFDVLEREVRPSRGRDSGVVQSRDVRVRKSREDVALARKAICEPLCATRRHAATSAPRSGESGRRPDRPATQCPCRPRRAGAAGGRVQRLRRVDRRTRRPTRQRRRLPRRQASGVCRESRTPAPRVRATGAR